MSKLCMKLRNKKREHMCALQKQKRTELKAQAIDPKLSPEERDAARMKLQDLPLNGAPARVRNRCQITGRGRGVYRKYKLCRNKFREMALEGTLPGVTKASW